ncbi:MAG: ATP synthase F0 subcomplex subunit OSCP atp5 [Phylliscum demangeonii]|nr:MAG: ATP synthase F0 subcomplex subunit OSCP atp5 [Phylliscum demangeonii]
MLASRSLLQASRAVAPRATCVAPRTAGPAFAVGRSYAQQAAAAQSSASSPSSPSPAPAPASASSSAATRPPLALFGVDGTYASALYTAAAKSSSLDATGRALSTLADVFKRDPKLVEVLAAPTLTAADKSAIVNELTKHMGAGGSSDLIKNFLRTLADNNRLAILEGVCEKFASLMGAHRGEVQLLVTSAVVDKEILGGLIVEVAGKTIDVSVSSRIARMNKLLTDVL